MLVVVVSSRLYCQCQSQLKTGKFVSGLSNFRIDGIQAHEDLKQHKAATKVAEWHEVKT